MSTPATDPSNPFVGRGVLPSMVTYFVVDSAQGQLLGMTFRTPDLTFTCFVSKKDAEDWHRMMGEQIAKMSSLKIAPANVQLPPMNGARPQG